MTIEEQILYWFDLAEEDLIVAESNYNQGHYLWCLFLCHLTLEKALKGLYIQQNQDVQPKIHDLIKIAKLSSIQISEVDLRFFNEMNRFNIEARYPDYKNQVKKVASKEFTEIKLNKTKEVYKWLKSLKK